MILPTILANTDEPIVFDRCTEEQWFNALECGDFAEGWKAEVFLSQLSMATIARSLEHEAAINADMLSEFRRSLDFGRRR